MDDQRLQDILRNISVPHADEDKKSEAVNMALAAFDSAHSNTSQASQGLSIFRRLMNGIHNNGWRRSMNTRVMYAGASTAIVIAFVVLIGITQYRGIETRRDSIAPVLSEKETQIGINAELKQKNVSAKIAAVESARGAEKIAQRSHFEFYMIPNDSLPVGYDASLTASVIGGIELPPGRDSVQSRDQFKHFESNPVNSVTENPVSTFSIDVDTSSYSFIRRQIEQGVLPQKDAVRIEEMINYFDYQYPSTGKKEHPFRPVIAVVPSPWNAAKKLIHIGIKGYEIPIQETPSANLVFLLDVSGSMDSPDKLPLLKNSMKLLLETLKPNDSVAIVVYAGAAGTVLEPTPVKEKTRILRALETLNAGGSTAGGEGIRQAYQLAEAQFDKDAINRVVLATDGDFNVGIVDREELKGFIERKRKTGIFLSVLGFGQGNLNDHLMQELAQNGNGVAAYIDTLNEARKVLVDEASSFLFPIAKDVKIQVEFNPDVVAEYRLIGYETRALNREDFNNDAVDAGDVGSGHTVTAIYEITPFDSDAKLMDELRYKQSQTRGRGAEFSGEYAHLKIRYKRPDQEKSELFTTPVSRRDELGREGRNAPEWIERETGWAAAVAGFGQLLQGGKYTGTFDYDAVIQLAEQHKGEDKFGYRSEFIQLVRLAKSAAAMNE